MGPSLKVSILPWLLLQMQITLAAWQVPYFIDTKTVGVSFQSALGVQKINVREELAWPFQLALINYKGNGKPTLGAFDIGDNSLLGANITQNDAGQWLVLVEKRQDFENSHQRIYSFQIYIKDDVDVLLEQGILMTLDNVFDNRPSLTYSPSPCRVEELRANLQTNCIFSVYDPDGMERNKITILTEGQSNEVGLFQFEEYAEITTYEKKFQLIIKRELHYEERAIYNLDVKVYDANNNTGSIFAILEVVDLPNRDPIWVRPLTTATFDEKQEQYFTLKAIDGDTGIDKPICYRLEFEEDYSQLMNINDTTGILHVQPIDRDARNQQVFTFYTCAYKCDNATWAIRNLTILIVQDINDHIPEITLVPDTVQILESKYLTLPLDTFLIEDSDLGNNATYNVYLRSSPAGIDYSKSFSLVPTSGYQSTNFSLTVLHAESLDFENVDWRSFVVTIVAQEIENATHTSSRSLAIELVNWNDEWPLFAAESYVGSVLENATSGTLLQRVYATDRDVDDIVHHLIVGNMSGLAINATTGRIITSADNVFDYERQQTLVLQIAARDSLVTPYSDLLHTSFAQLTINVVDVNDETPELRMPREIVNITENADALTILTDKIEARDPDTTANLSFAIDWSASYATKGGQEAERADFVDCFIVETQMVSTNLYYGLLRINPKFALEVDYEKYDTIFLSLRVNDLNQEINDGSATAVLTIRVDDVNDNPPMFVLSSLQEPKKVSEMAETLTAIGNIEAFDIDGPSHSIITFDLRPMGNLTADGLISINSTTGVLRVNGSIQCDLPKIYQLEYEIILSDMVHSTVGKLNVSIMDVNNRAPELDDFAQQVAIYENATNGFLVGQIMAHDDDRDVPHNVMEYTINSALGDVHNLFQINATNGVITVQMRNGLRLDRDNGVSHHYIAVDIKDNFAFNNPGYGPVNQRSTFLNVTLLDVNDNAPIMPPSALFSPEFSEAARWNTQSKIEFIATDGDEPGSDNSWVSYQILTIRPLRENAENVSDYEDLFTIASDNRVSGKLKSQKLLEGFYGWWEIQIEAYDHGEPVQRNSSLYELYVRPYNFHAPSLRYPIAQKSLRLCYALQEPNRPLYLADCVSRLPNFSAFDPDGGEYGNITFQISSADAQHFGLTKTSRNESMLQLQHTVPAGVYYLNVHATDGGGVSSEELRNLKIVFVDMLGNPMFADASFQTDFTENENGLAEQRYIPAAVDPKNEGLAEEDEQYPLYYFIDETIYADAIELFQLDSGTRALTLLKALDREAVDLHRLRVKVTNNANGLVSNPNSINYTLDVVVMVNDVNDNAPKFRQNFYAAGITLKDSIGKEVIVFNAQDADLDDPTSYHIDFASLQAHGEQVAGEHRRFFTLNSSSGALHLEAYVTNNMKGYFMFDIVAQDTATPPHTDKAAVKIYIVAEANRVRFVFLSDLQTIRDNSQLIREQFQAVYGYELCNIDSLDDVTNQQKDKWRIDDVEDAGADAHITDVIVHFINNNEAVDADEIQRRSADLAFVSKLQNVLQRHNLILHDVPHLSSDDVTPLTSNWLLTTLIITATLLAALCAALAVIFVLKLRMLRRQLKAFEPAEFGSDLSHMGAIKSNFFAAESANPIVIGQQNPQLKTRSAYEADTSSDSSEDEDEFAGLQDDPTFDMYNLNQFESEKPTKTCFEQKLLNIDFARAEQTAVSDLPAEGDKQRY